MPEYFGEPLLANGAFLEGDLQSSIKASAMA
jgi:hypothetical protein